MGVGTKALFFYPSGLACNGNNGDILVTDYHNYILRLISSPSRTVTLFAGSLGISGYADGVGTYAKFSEFLHHVAYNLVNKHFYVVDLRSSRIRQVTISGVVSTFAGRGISSNKDGLGTFSSFYSPIGIACDDDSGEMIIGDQGNHRIGAIDLSTN
jgi:hypothetical protein